MAESGPADVPKYVSRIWRTHDGLPESRIRALAQTRDGYLWVGTPGGLARFDGVRFVVYSRFNTPAMADDNIRALSLGRNGSLWIATDGGGLLQYQGGGFRSFGPKDGLANEFVGAVLEDQKGRVWAGTNRGLYVRRGARFERVDEAAHLPNIAFFALCERRDGTILAGGPAGLFRVEGDNLRQFGPSSLMENQFYLIQKMSDESLWLGTNHGLRTIGNTETDLKPIVGAIAEDHNRSVWLGTLGEGLVLVRNGKATAFQAPPLPNDSVSAILEDREQNIWVGTADGLVRMSAPYVQVLGAQDGLSDDNVSTIYSDRHGTLWLTTITGKVFRFANGRPEPFQFPDAVRALRFRGIFEDRNGAMWFGTDNQGVMRLANGQISRFTTREGLRNDGLQAFAEDPEGNLWIGTTSGISVWNGSRFQNYYLEQGLSYGWVRAIVQDRNGDMLIGTDRGINRFHEGRFVPDAAFAKLNRDRVWSIFPDDRGVLWIATRGAGLVRIADGKMARITTQEGLLSNAIVQVIGDGGGKLWMSGPVGLSSAALTDLDAVAEGRSPSVSVLSYGVGDGLESAQMNGGVQPAGCISSGGELWFPSVRGAIHFRPEHPRFAYRAPVRIESVLVDNQSRTLSSSVVVGPGQRHVEIEFTACTLRSPEQVAFRYKLDGADTKWVAATSRRSANYYNLAPGEYRFHVIARDGSLQDGSSEAMFSLVVRPYLYQTVWFYGGAVALLGLTVFGALRYQERQTRIRYNLRLAERTRIAREMHDTVVQGCVGVSTLIEAAVGNAHSDPDQMLEWLDNARIHLRMTIDEARQALADLRHDSFENGLTGALSELTRTVTGEKGIPVSLDVEGDPVPLPDSTNRALTLVAREAIRNAVAHAKPSTVRIRLSFGSAALRLGIEDDGCGFVPSAKQLVADGHFGILGMRERMEQIGGSLEVLSNAGKGTIIGALLPLRPV
ncbi:MAG TPA: two-component regulator propeller domain-containing protein [Candidatus Solibacter sp.]|nr:two-component regulator propeller domain-containing protein [Candidatus Solibacter sp.]